MTTTDERVLYFAYGSNLNAAQMLKRCGEVWVVGPATLPGHRLAFGGWSKRRKGGVATVLPAAAAKVDGLLFELTPAGLSRLDVAEGYPDAYGRTLADLWRWSGSTCRAWVYLKDQENFLPAAPSKDYLVKIRREYERHGFDLTALERAAREAA